MCSRQKVHRAIANNPSSFSLHINCITKTNSCLIYQPYLSLISSFKTKTHLKSLLQIHSHLIISGLKLDNTISTHLINSYSFFKRFDFCRSLFNSTPNPRVILYNSMIRAYNRENMFVQALQIYHLLLDKKLEPDKYTFTFVLKACAGCSDLDEGVLVHRNIFEKGLECDVYIGTSLVDMYCEFCELGYAKVVFDKMNDKDVVAWNAMIGGFSRGFDPLMAFEFFSDMLKSGITPNSVSFLNLFPAALKFKDIKLCKVLHGYISRRDFSRAVYNGLIDIYSKCGCSDSARMVFDQMLDHDDISWGTMMAGYTHDGYSAQVLELFNKMKGTNIKINKVSMTCSLLAAADLRDLEKGKEIHDCAIQQGIDQNIVVATSLMTMYAKCGQLKEANKLFKELKGKDIVSWSAAIALFLQFGCPNEALFLFREMVVKSNLKPNRVTLVSVLPACAELMCVRLGMSLHCFTIKFNFDHDVSTGTALLSFYAKCQLLTQATRVFESLPQKDVVTWNALINGFAQSNEPSRAISFFNQLCSYGVQADLGTLIGVLKAFSIVGDLKQGTSVFGFTVKTGFDSQCQMKNAVLDMFTKCGDLLSAELLFYKTEFTKDEVTWNIMIKGYVANGYAEKAIFTFNQMRFEEIIKPNLISIISVVPAIAHLSDVKEGTKVHSFVVRMGFESHTLVSNSLITLYAKCGNTEFSERIFFKEFGIKDLVSWNSLLCGYAAQGQGERAIALFSLMRRNHVEKVDRVSFISVLSACRHTGLVDEGREIFSSMAEQHGLEPDLEHYVCMVDLFGRAGLFEEALNFIKKIPMEPDAKVWRALLAGCKLHSNLTLGELVIDHLNKLEPQNPSHYVVSSALLSQCNRWVDAKDMRLKLDRLGLKKTPGCSWLSR